MNDHERMNYWYNRAKKAEEELFRMEQDPVWVQKLEDDVFNEME